MQLISFTGSDFLLEVACSGELIQPKTFTGQTEIQMPSPSQESWSTATLVPCIPSFPGGLTSPLTLCALCSPTTGFFMKSGSIVIFLSSFIALENDFHTGKKLKYCQQISIIGCSQQITVPALSETHSISHPQISQIYDMPSSAFCAFFVLTTFFDFGFSVFDSVFMAVIFPLSFHTKKQLTQLNVLYLAFVYLH